MELLSPAGSIEKLQYAYHWGADAAYTGLPLFSLRSRAEQLDDKYPDNGAKIAEIKGNKKLYVALNIYFHNRDLDILPQQLARVASWPIDGFIISDPSIIPLIRETFPVSQMHLSTQANCTNWRSAKMYYEMGFSRIVAAREVSLNELAEIKQRVPELEIEVFVHGAMCLAYAGRCILSAESSGRSANRGDCAHNCRWKYRVLLEEETRPGNMLEIESGETASGGYTLLLSSKDLCMLDNLEDLRRIGVDSIKIEGRVKSLCHTALLTRAYRFSLDNPGAQNPFREDIFTLSHREYGSGFFYGRDKKNTVSTDENYIRDKLFMGSIVAAAAEDACKPEENTEWGLSWPVAVKNAITPDKMLELEGPAGGTIRLDPYSFRVCSFMGQEVPRIANEHGGWLQISRSLIEKSPDSFATVGPFWLIRRNSEGK